MEKKIYLLEGTTGEYADTKTWIAGAFLCKMSAEAYKARLLELYKTFCGRERTRFGYMRDHDEAVAAMSAMRELDPSFYEDYTGTSYEIIDAPLHEG